MQTGCLPSRVKDMCSLETLGQRVLVTASSDGFIKAWRLSPDMKVPPALLCEVSTNARLTCIGVWLDSAVGSRAGRPPSAEQAVVSQEQSEVVQEEEEPSTKKRKAARGDKPGLAKRRAPMAELEECNGPPVAKEDGLPSAQQEATHTPEKRTRRPISGEVGLPSAKRKRAKKLEKSNNKPAARGSSLGPARKRKEQRK